MQSNQTMTRADAPETLKPNATRANLAFVVLMPVSLVLTLLLIVFLRG